MKRKLLHLCLSLLLIATFDTKIVLSDEFTSEEVIHQELSENGFLLENGEIPSDIIPPSDEFPDLIADDEDSDPATIFGRDDRVYIQNTDRHPYLKVVYLVVYFGNQEYNVGSGVMIAPNKVLTAAHVVRNVKTNQWAQYVTAFPGWNKGSYKYGGLTGSNFHVFTNFKNDVGIGYTSQKMHEDLAVVSLPYSFPSEVGYLPVADSVQVQQRALLIGYPGSNRPEDVGKIGGMYAVSGNILNVENKVIRYQMDMTPGHSGGPILNNSNQIIAINIAENSSRNIARRINSEGLELVNAALQDTSSGNGISNLKVTYRLYHSGEKYHFYSSSVGEKDALVKMGWKYEGIAWRTDTGGMPVYRLYHSGTRRHLYTTSVHERDILKTRGWNYEGVSWHSMGDKNVYRLYHPGIKVHLYTMDENEKNVLSTRGWNYEGIAWKVE